MMDAPVEWNGMFFVVGDYLILQGSVRSLFFNFDTKLVVTNIIELKAEEQMIAAVEQHPNVRDILNMVLYAFGKWFPCTGQDDFGLAELRPCDYCCSSRHG